MKKISRILSVVALTTFGGSAALHAQSIDTDASGKEPVVIVQELEKPEKINNDFTPDTKVVDNEPVVIVQELEKTEQSNNNFYNMGRGLTNVATCWMEVFRCMLYRNAEAPFWGFIAGAVEGSGLTAMRAFTGATDILFLGFEPGNIFEPRFAEFVWQSPWLPEPELQYKTPQLRQD